MPRWPGLHVPGSMTMTMNTQATLATAAVDVQGARHRSWRSLSFPFALLLLTALVYWPGLGGGYVFDDFPNIVDNTALHVRTLDPNAWLSALFSSPATELQRPLAMLTFAVNHYFTGLDPVPMKLTSLAIHLLNTLLVFALVRGMVAASSREAVPSMRAEWGARLAAAAWALHPINLMPVLFIVQRMESLSHTFVFAGLWLYLQGRMRQRAGRNGWWMIGTGLLLGTGLGVLAKESAVLLPLYAFCLELCLFGFRNGGGRDRRLYVLFAGVLFLPALLGVAWLLPKALAPGAFAARDFNLDERLLTEARVVLDYLRWTVFPDLGQLSLYHDDYPVSRGLWDPPMTLFAFLMLALLAAAAWAWRRRRPLASLGLLWFFAAQLLTATFVPLELVFEHRNYFASLGICVLLADLLLLAPTAPAWRRIGTLLAVLFVATLAGMTHLRAREWSDPFRFAASEAAKHPQSPRAAYALGRTLIVMSDYRADSPFLAPARTALERARRLPGSGILPHSALLVVAARSGQPQDETVWRDLQHRLRERPLGPQQIGAIASLMHCARDGGCVFPPAQMLATFDAALSHGRHPEVLTMYGDYALNVLRDPTLALRLWREVSQDHPRVTQYRVNLVRLLIALGEHRAAREQIAGLRAIGRLGQNEAAARALESRLENAQPRDPDPPAAVRE